MSGKRPPNSDAFGSMIEARDLPRECRPPYRGRTAWTGTHRGWRILVTRIEGDPLPHVVVSGHTTADSYEIHAKRLDGAAPASVRAWIDELLARDEAISS